MKIISFNHSIQHPKTILGILQLTQLLQQLSDNQSILTSVDLSDSTKIRFEESSIVIIVAAQACGLVMPVQHYDIVSQEIIKSFQKLVTHYKISVIYCYRSLSNQGMDQSQVVLGTRYNLTNFFIQLQQYQLQVNSTITGVANRASIEHWEF